MSLRSFNFRVEGLEKFKVYATNIIKKLEKDANPKLDLTSHIAPRSPRHHSPRDRHSIIDKEDHFLDTHTQPRPRTKPRLDIDITH